MNTGVFALDTNLGFAVDARRFPCAMQETIGAGAEEERGAAARPRGRQDRGRPRRPRCRLPNALTRLAMSGMLSDVRSFNVPHIRRHLAAVLADVEGGEVIEVRRRGRPVARIVPLPSVPSQSDWSHAEKRLQAVYPAPAGGATVAQTIADSRGER